MVSKKQIVAFTLLYLVLLIMFSIFLYKLFWSAEVWYNKGCAFDKLGKYKEAVKCYDKATDIDPEYINAWTCKSLALCKQGKYKKAIKCCDKALKIDPNNADAQTYKEEALKVLGNKCEQIIHDPALYGYLNNKGTVLYDQGKYEEAIKCYDKVLECYSKDKDAWYNKGCALARLEKYEEAIKCYDKALELYPNHAEAKTAKEDALKARGTGRFYQKH